MNSLHLAEMFWRSLERHPQLHFSKQDGLLCWAIDHLVLDAQFHSEFRASFLLDSPARVHYTTFGIGVAEEEVIRAAQQMYEQDVKPTGWTLIDEIPPEEDTILECVVIKNGNQMRKFIWFCGLNNKPYYVIDGELSMMIPVNDAQITHWRLPSLLPGEQRG